MAEDAATRGRLNRSRGNAIEREATHILRITRTGQFGTKHDGGAPEEWVTVQVKSGGTYPERIDKLLRSLSPHDDQLRAVVHADTPGPGHKRRWLITFDMREFMSLLGNDLHDAHEENTTNG